MRIATQVTAMAFGFLAATSNLYASTSPYTSLFVFGDSYSDSGAGYVDTNGPTAVAYMALDLGIPFTFAGAPNAAGKGLNFAVSGAQTGAGPGVRFPTGELLNYGMLNQVADFRQQVDAGSLSFVGSQTLFFLAGGLNDGTLTSDQTVANLSSEVLSLYQRGARHFELALLPTKVPAFAEVASRLNPVYRQLVPQLNALLPGSDIRLSNFGSFFDTILDDPTTYGFTNTTDRCAGRALFNEDATPCASPDAYFYYHASHPSTAAHSIVGRMLADEILATAVPEPATYALLLAGLSGMALARRAVARRVEGKDPEPSGSPA